MRSLLSGTDRPPFGDAIWLNAMAAIAVGMFIGNWVIGPALSGDPAEHAKLRSAKFERAELRAAAARSDPSPYRTPTPDFGVPEAPQYGKFAKEQARTAFGERGNDIMLEADSYGERPWVAFEAGGALSRYRNRPFERHNAGNW
jgi:hypothetical protein